MRVLCGIAVLLSVAVATAAENGPVFCWQFAAEHVQGGVVKPVAGQLDATIVGPVKFCAELPRALLLDGNVKEKHRIDVASKRIAAGLPATALTVEAWVRIDKTAKNGGLVGVVTEKGSPPKGWQLGYRDSQFSFGVAGNDEFRVVMSRNTFRTGFWYHVVGTYDGSQQRLYVDGTSQGRSSGLQGPIAYSPEMLFTIGAYRRDREIVPLAGQLEMVSVHDRALTPREVSARFDERKSRFPDIETAELVVADWPTYLRDNLRTGITPENLSFPLKLRWVHQARHAPRPSWPEEAKEDYWHRKVSPDERVTYDRAFHIVAVGPRVFYASSAEDMVCCLDGDTGRENWSFFAEGPVRLAPTVTGERILFGSDDGFLYCLGVLDGRLLWKVSLAAGPRRIAGNGRIISAWPVRTDVLVEGTTAYVCAGVFPGTEGVFRYAVDVRDGKILDRRKLGNTAQGYLQRTSQSLFVTTGRDPAGAFAAQLRRRGKEIGNEVSNFQSEYPFAFIGAGDVRLGGGDGKIAAFRIDDGNMIWSQTVDGKVYSLAVSQGRLLAGTDQGSIYCFAADAAEPRRISSLPPSPRLRGEGPGVSEYPNQKTKKQYADAAERIIRETGIRKGYCLVLGSDQGRLAYELAKRSELQVVGREPNAAKVAASRKTIHAAGLSDRIAIHHGPLDLLPYSDYLFNLVVGESVVFDETFPTSREETLRITRPCGGTAVFRLTEQDMVRRGPLEGAGDWSHMYADTGNTACSGDRRVGGRFQLQWFGQPGARPMIDRHHRTVAPLCKNGRLFVPGEDRVIAVDAYNGTILWDRELPNSRRVVAFRDCSYLVATDEHLYVAADDKCLVLDAQTGETLDTWSIPVAPDTERLEWGYLGVAGNVLVASAVKPGSSRREQSRRVDETVAYWDFVPAVCSEFLFAIDRRTGKHLWTYRPKSGPILNPTIAIGESIHFIESTNAETLDTAVGRAKLSELLGKGSNLVALDLLNGQTIWNKPGPFEELQHNAYLCCARGEVVVVGSRNSGTDRKTAALYYDIHVFDAKTGIRKWFKAQKKRFRIGGDHGEQDQHPVIVGDTLYCEPHAFNLHTGEPAEWKWPWADGKRRGCGTLSASASTLFFRDGTVSLFDLTTNQASKATTSTRPGCWINLIPAGGLLLAPEASSGCMCNFSVQTSLAFIPVTEASTTRPRSIAR